jgi:Ring finger domain
MMTQLPCGHVYHTPCIAMWLEQNCTCPCCRYELPTDDMIFEMGLEERMRSIRSSEVNTTTSITATTDQNQQQEAQSRAALKPKAAAPPPPMGPWVHCWSRGNTNTSYFDGLTRRHRLYPQSIGTGHLTNKKMSHHDHFVVVGSQAINVESTQHCNNSNHPCERRQKIRIMMQCLALLPNKCHGLYEYSF